MADETTNTPAEVTTPVEETAAPKAEDVPAQAEKKEEKKEEKVVETPAKFKDLVEKIEKMSVLELHELVKHLEEKFGVSAQAVVVAGNGGGAADAGEEKDSFDVQLVATGDQKVQVIKAIKEALGLGLKEAKDLVDGAPSMLKEGAKKDDAEAIKKAIETVGGKVELK